MSDHTADQATLSRVIDDVFEALGVTDNEAALVEIDRLKALRASAPEAPDLAFQRGAEAMRDECMSIIRTYRDHTPEEDETWESWYFAAFDLALGRIKDLTSDEPIESRDRRAAPPARSAAMTDKAPDPLLDIEEGFDAGEWNNTVPCAVCKGSGFSGRGTGYDDVCGECGGLKCFPVAPPVRSTATSAEPDAWQYRYRLSVEWRDVGPTPIEQYRSAYREEIAKGDILLRPLYTTPPSSGNADAVRATAIHECIMELQASYPDHAWLNAACAALRALSSAPVAGEWQEALKQIAAVCADNAGDECDQKLALRFVANVAGRALSRNDREGGAA